MSAAYLPLTARHHEMRILEIIGTVDPRDGGAIEGLIRQSEVRAQRGLETHIASLDGPEAPWVLDCPVKTFGLGAGIPNFRGPLWERYGYTPRFVRWLRDNVTDYDIVVVNGLWTYASLASRRVLPASAVPYVVFPHGMLDPWFRTSNPVKHAAKQMLWLASEGPLLANARNVLFTTEAEMERARNTFWPYRVRGRVVGYGTADIEGSPAMQKAAFRRVVPALADKPFLLFLGRIHPKKGCDILVDAFARVASAYPELDLVIAGPDQNGWRAALEPVARAFGIAERIHWPGMLSGDAKWGAFRDCRAFVLPSHQENFGVVVAEALAAGRPVLITDKVNICREVEAAGAGMVSSDDAAGVGRMLGDFLSLSAHDAQRMEKAARACFLARFEISIAVDALCAALAEAKTCGPAARERAPVRQRHGRARQGAPSER
jgi:glycosyltransferase involved in cell wall biosynthesis